MDNNKIIDASPIEFTEEQYKAFKRAFLKSKGRFLFNGRIYDKKLAMYVIRQMKNDYK